MKRRITNYTFSAAAKTITLGDYTTVSLEGFLLVTNATDNIIIFNFADPLKGGTVATNVLTLTYDTTAMADADKLQIFYDDDFGYSDEKNFRTLRVVHVGDVGITTNAVVTSSSTLDVKQLSGSIDSTNVVQWNGNAVAVGDELKTGTPRFALVNDIGYSVNATQTGTWNVGTVASITASTAASLVDSGGVQYSGSNPLPIRSGNTLDVVQLSGAINSVNVNQWQGTALAVGDELVSGIPRVALVNNVGYSVSATQVGTWNVGTVTTVTSITNSLATANVDSSGVQYSGSNPLPTYLVTGSGNSTMNVGPTVGDAVDDGSAPIQIGGIARTANPTAVAANDVVKATMDDLGRQITRPFQMRDLTVTAYVTLSTGTEATLLAASAGSLHDLVYIMGANTSTAAVQVDIRPVTAGNIVMTLYIPASSTAGVALPMPFPQSASDTGNNWTVDMGDFTNSNVLISALFVREV